MAFSPDRFFVMPASRLRQVTGFNGKKQDESGRSIGVALGSEIGHLARTFMLPSEVKNRAYAIGAEASRVKLGQSFTTSVMAAASVYVACREAKNTTTLKDLAAVSASDPRNVGRCYLQMLDRMEIHRPDLNGREYLFHLALKKPISEDSLKLSQELIKKATSRGLGGRNPMTLAASSLYLACCSMGEEVTQAELAVAAGVGEETVRDCCKDLRKLEVTASPG